MKRFIFFLISLIGNWGTLTAQEALGFELSHSIEQSGSNELIPLLIEGDPSLKDIIPNYGGRVRMQVGDLFSAEIPAEMVRPFVLHPKVKHIEFSNQPGRLMGDTMLINNRIEAIHQGLSPLPQAYTGKGVIVGIIDSGIDYNHPDFQDSLGRTRILNIWDQRFNVSSRFPHPYNYGTEWDSTDINAGICNHDDPSNQFGHGSNVSGAAAGNGLGSGHFIGIAPESDLIVVASRFSAQNWLQTIAEAVNYIYQKADAMGRPCVINASVGTYIGSHDGKDIAARMIDAMIKAKSGRSFVCAQGNAGGITFHLGYQVTADTSFTWFEYNPNLSIGSSGIYFQLWSDTADFKQVQFAVGADKVTGGYQFRGRTAFDNIQNRLNVLYLDSITNSSGDVLAYVETFAEESEGRYSLEVALRNPDSSQYLYRFETTGSGKFDVWSSATLTGSSNMIYSGLPTVAQFSDMVNYQAPDSLQSMVSSFTCLPSAISVGNYTNRSNYVDVSGTTRQTGATGGSASPNSSLGPNRLGYTKPDISAAGDYQFGAGRLATINALINSQPSKISFDSLHYRNGGTSMAAPGVAGVAALMLEKCPNATYLDIKNAILNTAYTDHLTAPNLPDYKWGIGKLDGFAALNSTNFTPSLVVNQATPLCEGDSATVSLFQNYQGYLWNTGDTNATLIVKQSDTVFATVENLSGCRASTNASIINFAQSPPAPQLVQNGDTLLITTSNVFYQWFYNGVAVNGATDSSFVANADGHYHCRVYHKTTGCFKETTPIWVSITQLSELASNDKFRIYPNPSNGSFSIRGNGLQNLEILDITGKLIRQITDFPSGQLLEVNLSPITEGVYFIRLYSDQGIVVRKLVIHE